MTKEQRETIERIIRELENKYKSVKKELADKAKIFEGSEEFNCLPDGIAQLTGESKQLESDINLLKQLLGSPGTINLDNLSDEIRRCKNFVFAAESRLADAQQNLTKVVRIQELFSN